MTDKIRQPVPRGIARTGPAILSYGFRPFFLAAGMEAILAMGLWIAALSGAVAVGGSPGPLAWHAHEMLFGYATAALAGFLLTAVPNWTGRLPVSGLPLLALFLLWLAGRIVMAAPDLLGVPVSAAVDAAFLPALAFVAGREVIAGRNWRNLKVVLGLAALFVANGAFHVSMATGFDPGYAIRGAVSVYAMLIALVGGRIVPSFTRNVIARSGGTRLPAPFDRFDRLAVAALAVALAAWVAFPAEWPTAVLAAAAALIQAVRLARWQGGQVLHEPLLAMLHAGYAFLPLGLAAVAAAALGWLSAASALHVLTVGAIGGMTLAVMTRASLGHTGRQTTASKVTAISYLALLVAAVTRPFAELLPQHYHLLLEVSGTAWLLAFALFLLEYGPMLLSPRAEARAKPRGRPA